MGFRGEWDPGFVSYEPGDVVMYNGSNYRIVQPHRSQSDWPPPNVPALWEKLSGYQAPSSQCPPQQPHPQPQQPYQQPQQPQQPSQQGSQPTGGYTTQTGVQVSPEEAKKPWYDLDDDKKKLLWGGGGLAVGLAALGGGLYYEHDKHRKEGEEEKAQAYEIQNWILKCRERTEMVLQGRSPAGPLNWVWSEAVQQNSQLRNQLIVGGNEHGQPWFISRAMHHGSIQPGKARLEEGCSIGYGNEAIKLKQFEILVGDPHATKWVRAHGKLNTSALNARPVEGGHDADGSPLFIARVNYKDGIHPGKASSQLKGGYFTYGNKERSEDDYEVLCYV